jgi:transaldolase
MALYLDSGIIAEATEVLQWGWVNGVTTNPALLAKSELSAKETLTQLKNIFTGEIYYQLTASDFDDMVQEGEAAFNLLGEQTVLKIPATELGFKVLAHLSPKINCSVTAIYSAAQAAVAQQAGAKYAIAYVNRATRLLGDGIGLVKQMADVLAETDTKILAASIKSPEEAAATIAAGADHLTLPFGILKAMTTHELSEKTVEEFNQVGIGLLS